MLGSWDYSRQLQALSLLHQPNSFSRCWSSSLTAKSGPSNWKTSSQSPCSLQLVCGLAYLASNRAPAAMNNSCVVWGPSAGESPANWMMVPPGFVFHVGYANLIVRRLHPLG